MEPVSVGHVTIVPGAQPEWEYTSIPPSHPFCSIHGQRLSPSPRFRYQIKSPHLSFVQSEVTHLM